MSKSISRRDDIVRLVEQKKDIYFDVNDQIWEFAEIRYALKKSADLLCQTLEKEGFTITRNLADMEDAFIASYGTEGPIIGLLGEYDALSGMNQVAGEKEMKQYIAGGDGHGCGHQTLGTAAMAGAIAVKDYLKENNMKGIIRFYGCPAEEGGSGKAYMARAGIFSDLDAALAWHPQCCTGTMNFGSLANYAVNFIFKGISSHAAVAPHLGRSALDAVELMNVGVNYLREHIIPEARVHYALINGGGLAPNVVQSVAQSLYYCRAPKSKDVKEIYDRIVDCAKGAALMTGTTLEIRWQGASAEVIPNDVLGRLVQEKMEEIGQFEITEEEMLEGQAFRDTLSDAHKNSTYKAIFDSHGVAYAEHAKELTEKPYCDEILPYAFSIEPLTAGSNDVGDVSWNVPTCIFMVACFPTDTPYHCWQWVALGKSSVVHKSLLFAAETFALTALELFENEEVLEKAKAEFKKSLGGNKYNCPIPPDVKPR